MKTILSLFLSFFLLLSSTALAKKELKITLMVSSGSQRAVFVKLIQKFQKHHPFIDVNRKEYEQEKYKKQISHWLAPDKHHSDVLFWFAGTKLKGFVKKGWLEPLDDLWVSQEWNKGFSKAAKDLVSEAAIPYGLPMSYYQWGFYYRKSVFKAHNLTPPETWSQFLSACEILKQNNISPIVLGSKYRWPAAGWFDYLNLRINGLDFHQSLMEGRESYTDSRIKTVFNVWKDLLDKGYFLDTHTELDWRGALPYLYRKRGGMLLMGNFLVPQLPGNIKTDIGFFKFPKINTGIGCFEEAPMDILVIPKNAANKNEAKLFLAFIGQPDIQHDINSAMGMISPHKEAKAGDDRFIVMGTKILAQAEGFTQFYDRDTPPEMYGPGMDAFVEFMENPGRTDTILKKLEKIRQAVFQ